MGPKRKTTTKTTNDEPTGTTPTSTNTASHSTASNGSTNSETNVPSSSTTSQSSARMPTVSMEGRIHTWWDLPENFNNVTHYKYKIGPNRFRTMKVELTQQPNDESTPPEPVQFSMCGILKSVPSGPYGNMAQVNGNLNHASVKYQLSDFGIPDYIKTHFKTLASRINDATNTYLQANDSSDSQIFPVPANISSFSLRYKAVALQFMANDMANYFDVQSPVL